MIGDIDLIATFVPGSVRFCVLPVGVHVTLPPVR